jgi:hypothetical protein
MPADDHRTYRVLRLLAAAAVVLYMGSDAVRLHHQGQSQSEAAAFLSVGGTLNDLGWKTGKRRRVVPTYSFVVGGKEYTGNHHRFLRPRTNSACLAIVRMLEPKVGDQIPVYYDPADPTISLLDPTPEPPGELSARLALPYTFLVIGLLWLVFEGAGLVNQALPRTWQPVPDAGTDPTGRTGEP